MSAPLDPRFTFESFVVGPGNRLAAAAARRSAESPGTSYNPLVFYSGPGLGKTHLLNAIGHLALAVQPDLLVRYEPLEGFVDRLSGAIASNTLNRVREEYTGLGLLLLDDVQFLAGKARTQEELLRIWDEMSWRTAQVVLASDRPPQEIDGLDERLTSRFSGGLIVDISPPDPDTRVAIIQRKATERGIELAAGVADALARLSFDSVRELQGGLNRVLAVQEVEGRRVSPEEVAMLLGVESVRVSTEDEFSAFLTDISSTVAELVETAPWRKKVAEAILRWEGEGVRTRRLEEALEADSAPDVDAFLSNFAAEIARLRQIAGEVANLEPRMAAHPALKDPDRLQEAESLLSAARAAARPFVAPPAGTLEEAAAVLGADALALRQAERLLAQPSPDYNPLFVYGADGEGRTALLAGIGNAMLGQEGKKVAYLRGADLAVELAQVIEVNATELWRNRYRRIHLLLLDDVHELGGDARVQEEVFHLLDTLLRAGIQVVASADRPPRALTHLDERLRSRFEGGLVVELQPATATDGPSGVEGSDDAGGDLAGALPARAEPSAAPAGEPAPAGRPTGSGGSALAAGTRTPAAAGGGSRAGGEGRVDGWFFNPEKIAWSWIGLDDRLIEELG